MKSMFDIIKRQNGEAFAKAIRNYDSHLLELPDLPHIVKYAGREAQPILGTLRRLMNKIDDEQKHTYKSPYELLSEAGYDSFYADTLEKQNSIKHYFAPGEELCTFRDSTRFKNFYIIHAIKKNVDEIKRENFPHPSREDEYGTSVISIQVLKRGGFISIKNRYNHAVRNPDNTFDSNPDNIISGLGEAISREFKVNYINTPTSYIFVNNQICKVNSEVGNVYFGDGFYIKNGNIHEINKDYQVTINDVFLLDLRAKEIILMAYDYALLEDCIEHGIAYPYDELEYLLNSEMQGKKLGISRDRKTGQLTLFLDGEEFLTQENGKIISLRLQKGRALNNFPAELLGNLRYYDGVEYCTKITGFKLKVPFTNLPKPPRRPIRIATQRTNQPIQNTQHIRE